MTKKGRQLFGRRKVHPERENRGYAYEKRMRKGAPPYVGMGPRMIDPDLVMINFTSPETGVIVLADILKSARFLWTKHRNVTDRRTHRSALPNKADCTADKLHTFYEYAAVGKVVRYRTTPCSILRTCVADTHSIYVCYPNEPYVT